MTMNEETYTKLNSFLGGQAPGTTVSMLSGDRFCDISLEDLSALVANAAAPAPLEATTLQTKLEEMEAKVVGLTQDRDWHGAAAEQWRMTAFAVVTAFGGSPLGDETPDEFKSYAELVQKRYDEAYSLQRKLGEELQEKVTSLEKVLDLTEESRSKLEAALNTAAVDVQDMTEQVEAMRREVVNLSERNTELAVQAQRDANRADANAAAYSRVRKALLESGRNAGALLSESVSDDFLMNVPEEVRLVRNQIDEKAGEWKKRAIEAENERDSFSTRLDFANKAREDLRGRITQLETEVAIERQRAEGSAAVVQKLQSDAAIDLEEYNNALKAVQALSRPDLVNYSLGEAILRLAEEASAKTPDASADAIFQTLKQQVADLKNETANLSQSFSVAQVDLHATYDAIKALGRPETFNGLIASEVIRLLNEEVNKANARTAKVENEVVNADGVFKTLRSELQSANKRIKDLEAQVPNMANAAKTKAKGSSSSLREQIYKHIKKCGKKGATSDEVEVALHLPHQTCSARINELENADRVLDSGTRRSTRSGGQARVFVTLEHFME